MENAAINKDSFAKNYTLYDPIYMKCLQTESRLVATERGVREEGRLLLDMGSFFR